MKNVNANVPGLMTLDEQKAYVRAQPNWKPNGDPNCSDCLSMSHCETHHKTEGKYPEPTDTYWFRSDAHRAEAQFTIGYTLGNVKERAEAFAREWGVPEASVTYGLVSTAVE